MSGQDRVSLGSGWLLFLPFKIPLIGVPTYSFHYMNSFSIFDYNYISIPAELDLTLKLKLCHLLNKEYGFKNMFKNAVLYHRLIHTVSHKNSAWNTIFFSSNKQNIDFAISCYFSNDVKKHAHAHMIMLAVNLLVKIK